MAGDALDLLPGALAAVPGDAVVCLFHSFTVNQFSPEARERLASLIAEQASHRDLYWVSLEGRGGEYALLELTSFRRGKRTDRVLARCSAHGDWLEWLDGEPTTGGAE